MASSICVAIRVRPFSDGEREKHSPCVVRMDEHGRVFVATPGNKAKEHVSRFDYAFSSFNSTPGPYQAHEAMLGTLGTRITRSLLDGENVCLIAHGHSNTGKTYCLVGQPNVGSLGGLLPTICQDILEKKQPTDTQVVMQVSAVEVYCEQVYDLLENRRNWPKQGWKVSGTQQSGFQVSSRSRTCHTIDEVARCLLTATTNQTREGHPLFKDTAKSHVMYQVQIQISKAETITHNCTFTVVELAGPLRYNPTSRVADPQGKAVNWGLSCLSNVMSTLNRKQAPSFQDSKLTMLLQRHLEEDTLYGLGTISPAAEMYSSTIDTIHWCSRLYHIRPIPPRLKKLSPTKASGYRAVPPTPTQADTESSCNLLVATTTTHGSRGPSPHAALSDESTTLSTSCRSTPIPHHRAFTPSTIEDTFRTGSITPGWLSSEEDETGTPEPAGVPPTPTPTNFTALANLARHQPTPPPRSVSATSGTMTARSSSPIPISPRSFTASPQPPPGKHMINTTMMTMQQTGHHQYDPHVPPLVYPSLLNSTGGRDEREIPPLPHQSSLPPPSTPTPISPIRTTRIGGPAGGPSRDTTANSISPDLITTSSESPRSFLLFNNKDQQTSSTMNAAVPQAEDWFASSTLPPPFRITEKPVSPMKSLLHYSSTSRAYGSPRGLKGVTIQDDATVEHIIDHTNWIPRKPPAAEIRELRGQLQRYRLVNSANRASHSLNLKRSFYLAENPERIKNPEVIVVGPDYSVAWDWETFCQGLPQLLDQQNRGSIPINHKEDHREMRSPSRTWTGMSFGASPTQFCGLQSSPPRPHPGPRKSSPGSSAYGATSPTKMISPRNSTGNKPNTANTNSPGTPPHSHSPPSPKADTWSQWSMGEVFAEAPQATVSMPPSPPQLAPQGSIFGGYYGSRVPPHTGSLTPPSIHQPPVYL